MGNEQTGGTNDHLSMDTSTNRNREHRRGSHVWAEKISSINNTKSTWQRARDMSMDILSKKNTKLTFKQSFPPNINSSRSISKQHLSRRSSIISESLQVPRVPRMPTEKEASEAMIGYDSFCSLCKDTCTSDHLRCRICPKSYHSKCLFQHGYIRNLSMHFPRFGKHEWTCPECTDLTRLLSETELHYLIEAFEHIDRDKDGYIVLEEFLTFQTHRNTPEGLELFIQSNPHFGKRLFSLIDSSQKGAVAWTDFALFYSCKLMVVKNQTELTTKLTAKELVMARKLFLKDPKKNFDNNYNIIITKEYFTQIYHELIQSLKQKYGIEFINMIIGDDCENNEPSKKPLVMDWTEYLRGLALLLLLNRCNDNNICSQPRRASIPRHLSNVSTMSLPGFSSNEFRSSSRLALSRSNTPVTLVTRNPSCDDVFIKHAKILEKLNRKDREDEFKKKQIGSLIQFTIVESLDEDENINIPKLKINGRDDRRTITDPWTSVKEMEQLRNQPIPFRITRCVNV